jgi:hypothetical protein
MSETLEMSHSQGLVSREYLTKHLIGRHIDLSTDSSSDRLMISRHHTHEQSHLPESLDGTSSFGTRCIRDCEKTFETTLDSDVDDRLGVFFEVLRMHKGGGGLPPPPPIGLSLRWLSLANVRWLSLGIHTGRGVFVPSCMDGKVIKMTWGA